MIEKYTYLSELPVSYNSYAPWIFAPGDFIPDSRGQSPRGHVSMTDSPQLLDHMTEFLIGE